MVFSFSLINTDLGLFSRKNEIKTKFDFFYNRNIFNKIDLKSMVENWIQ